MEFVISHPSSSHFQASARKWPLFSNRDTVTTRLNIERNPLLQPDKFWICHGSKSAKTPAIIDLSPMSPMSPLKYPFGGGDPEQRYPDLGRGDSSTLRRPEMQTRVAEIKSRFGEMKPRWKRVLARFGGSSVRSAMFIVEWRRWFIQAPQERHGSRRSRTKE